MKQQTRIFRGFSFCNSNCSICRIFCYRSIRSLKTLFPTNLKSLRKFRQFIQTKTNKKHREANWVQDTAGPSINFSCLLNCVSYFHEASSGHFMSPSPTPNPEVDLLLRFPKSTERFFEVRLTFWASTLAITQDHGKHFLFVRIFDKLTSCECICI